MARVPSQGDNTGHSCGICGSESEADLTHGESGN